MRHLLITTVEIALVLLIVTQSNGQEPVKKHIVLHLSKAGQPITLDVKLQFGSIHILGYDGPDVVIDADSGEKKLAPTVADGHGKPIAKGHTLNFTAVEEGNAVTVKGSPDDLINLTIRLPVGHSVLKLSTVNQGDIIVDHVKGSIEASNTNGTILLTQISGSLVANTTNGDVRATFDSVDPATSLSVTILNGDIELTLPHNFKANLQMNTDVGTMYSDFIISGNNLPSVRDQKTRMFRFGGEQRVIGRINGGGAEMLLKVLDGNIYLKKPKS